eukprot:TRINITY_DN6259_c0_g2_i1.p1 TRINITY_DN6259_c0_g2~~TRINITY_DN6259_c0_g2_i1.p1  ORF type:complete len:1096 (-),score=170.02 TRINITY_DN6259_c0_g2_i1:343-3630(-)
MSFQGWTFSDFVCSSVPRTCCSETHAAEAHSENIDSTNSATAASDMFTETASAYLPPKDHSSIFARGSARICVKCDIEEIECESNAPEIPLDFSASYAQSNAGEYEGLSSWTLQLDGVLKHQFGGDLSNEAQAPSPSVSLFSREARLQDVLRNTALTLESNRYFRNSSGKALVEHRFFTGFFMVITIFALLAPDFDVIFGNRQSEFLLSVISTAVFGLFFVETLLFSLYKDGYRFRAYFWLDLVALISVLPDTYVVQQLSSSAESIPSTPLTRLVRLVARSAKATRMNRWTRMVRIARLLPRLLTCLRPEHDMQAMPNLLDRKLRHLYKFVDQDEGGVISSDRMQQLLRYLTRNKPRVESSDDISPLQVRSLRSSERGLFAFGRRASTASTRSASPHTLHVDSVSPHGASAHATSLTDAVSTPRQHVGSDSESPARQNRITFQVEIMDDDHDGEICTESGDLDANHGLKMGANHADVKHDSGAPMLRSPSVFSMMSGMSSASQEFVYSYSDFKDCILSDEWVKTQLYSACRQEFDKSANLQAIGRQHAEDVGVKVALGVLILLFVLSFLTPQSINSTAILGLRYLDSLANSQFRLWTNDSLPSDLQEQVILWRASVQGYELPAKILRLDLIRRTVCDELGGGGPWVPCSHPANLEWTWLKHTLGDRNLGRLPVRSLDVEVVWLPSNEGDAEDTEEQRRSMAVLDMHEVTVARGLASLFTTLIVLVIMLAGITAVTSDLGRLSQRLLNPLRSLEEEMLNIAHLQLAGFEPEDGRSFGNGVAEVRLIKGIFSNTKTAIRSWGKYVPWPVVQLLLAAGVDAQLKMETKEISIFFSDIASFTSIVEKLPPERSLLLLSRYFNDMSTVIEKHGGVVLEFIGDAIFSVFGAPAKNDNHAEACVRATLKMLKTLNRINRWSRLQQLPEVSIRCGIHTGEVLVGNMGFHSRMKYGIVGDNANIPAKLEELSKSYGTGNLVSEATLRRLPDGVFITRPIDYRYQAGTLSEPVHQILGQVYTHDAEKRTCQELQAFAASYKEALDKYRARDFSVAAVMFDNLRKNNLLGKDDRASLVLHGRSKFYAARPPLETWEGVWDQAAEPD